MSTLNFVDVPTTRGYSDYSKLPVARFDNTSSGNFAFGTLDRSNTLDALRVFNGTVIQYDRDLLQTQIGMILDAQNHLTAEQLSMFCQVSTERFVRVGSQATTVFEDLDLMGIPNPQKIFPTGSEQGWPLRRKGVALQWTSEYFRNLPMSTFANQLQSLLTADAVSVAKQIRHAIFYPTNNTFIDRFMDSYSLPVKALLNADSVQPPPNAYGTVFDGSVHTHYMYPSKGNGDTITATSTTAWNNNASVADKANFLGEILLNLREHYVTGTAKILVSTTEAPFFTTRINTSIIPGFAVLEYAQNIITQNVNRDRATGPDYNPQNAYDRMLGYFDGAEVWVKPWIPAGYCFAYDPTQPLPVQVRVPSNGAMPGTDVNGASSLGAGNLRLIQEYDQFPLMAQAMVRDLGMAASVERWNGVVGYLNSASSYTAPTGLTTAYALG